MLVKPSAAVTPSFSAKTGSTQLGWWLRWAKALGSYTAAQVAAQGISALVGFILVRHMTKPEYAWFSIANSMAATFTLLTDSGTTTGLQSIGGGIWQDRRKFSDLLATGMRLRFRLGAAAALICVPSTIWLLHRTDATVWTMVMITLLVIAPPWITSSFHVLNMFNRLHTRVGSLARIDLASSLTRLLVIVCALPGQFISAVFATIATAVSQFCQWLLVRRQVLPHLDLPTADPAVYHREMVFTVKHCFPTIAYNCVQGQVGTWILGALGASASVADLGALTRIALVFAMLLMPLHAVLAPAFARCRDHDRLLGLACKIMTVYSLACVALVVLCWLFSRQVLWVLGHQYQHLHHELVLAAIMFSVTGFGTLLWALIMARGWVRWSWLSIPAAILGQVIGVLVLDLSSVRNVILFSICAIVPPIFLAFGLFWKGYRSTPAGSR